MKLELPLISELAYLILLLIAFNNFSFPQQSSLSKSVNYLSQFIASVDFKNLKQNNNDLALTDTIYLRALQFSNQDYNEALLALTFATVPYKEVPLQFPLFNFILKYPLISAEDSVFQLKNKNLPKYFFFDSPQNDYGDKDKLAHFFGSAFTSYNSHIFDLGNLIGYFVEVFEEDFKVQSSIDERDLMVDNLGYIFGKILLNDKNILPSRIILSHLLFHVRIIL